MTALAWLAHAPWGRFTFILAAFAAFLAWGCWCQHTLNRDERRAREREALRREALAYAIEHSPSWAALNLPPAEARQFAEWEAGLIP